MDACTIIIRWRAPSKSVTMGSNRLWSSILTFANVYVCEIFQKICKVVSDQKPYIDLIQSAYGESAFEELDEIFYIVQQNNI